MWYAVDNDINFCHICAKGLLDPNFNQAVIHKVSNFTKLLNISRTHKDDKFKSIFFKLMYQLLLSYKLYGRDI